MERITIALSLLILLFCGSALAQPASTAAYHSEECYPQVYTFSKATEFRSKGELDKAAWFYINLFDEDPDAAIAAIRGMRSDTEDTEMLLRRAFSMYFPHDPENLKSAHPGMNTQNPVLKVKNHNLDMLVLVLDDRHYGGWKAEQLNTRSLEHFKLGDLANALADLDTALGLDTTAQLLYNRGYILHQLGRYSAAEADFAASIRWKHRIAESYYYRGFSRSKLGRKSEAMADFSASIQADPLFFEPRLSRGFEYFLAKQYPESIADFDAAIALDPSNPEGYVSRGFAHFKAGNQAAACADWRKAHDFGLEKVQATIVRYCETADGP